MTTSDAAARIFSPPVSRPARLVVLASGGGSNLQALIGACSHREYGAHIVAVGTDRPNTGAEQLAIDAGIPHFCHRISDFDTRAQWDAALTDSVAEYQPDMVISAGFLKLVGPRFLAKFSGRFFNTHNALLPSFPGIHGPADALAYGVRITGATLFVVDEGVDTGAIIAQVAVYVDDADTVETLTERIKTAERAQLVEYVGTMARHGWKILGRRARPLH